MAALVAVSIVVIASVGAAAFFMLKAAPGDGGGGNGTPLSVSISPDTSSGDIPLNVKFTSTVAGGKSPYTYNWDFGDGQHGTEANPNHAYQDNGTFSVKLTVRDSAGKSKESNTLSISALRGPLSVSISSNITIGQVPLAVKFNTTVGGGKAPYTYRWDFGDGKSGTGASPGHTFADAGNYSVKLNVTDSAGAYKESAALLIQGLRRPVLSQLLIYDPTGNNVKSPGRAASNAYLVNLTDDVITSKTPVEVESDAFPAGRDPAKPMTVSGQFETTGQDGAITISKITALADEIITNGSFGGFKFRNIEAHLSSVSIVAREHTFGFGYGREGEPIAYISMDKKPTFFTNVTLRGIVLPQTVGEALDFLDANIPSEFDAFKGAFRQFGDLADISRFSLGLTIILADTIEYENPMVITGDVLDVYRPEDVQKLIDALSGGDLDQESYDFISDILDSINMELIMMTTEDLTRESIDLWLIVGITDLARDETVGLVSLNIAEVTQSDIERELGIDIPDTTANLSLRLHYAVCGDSDDRTNAPASEIRGLWTAIESSTHTAASGLSADCFAMVLGLNQTLTYMESLMQTDLGTLKALTAVRNPGVGLLIDTNFTEVLDNNQPFEKYTALALIPDVDETLNPNQLLYSVHINGTVYDLGKFLQDPQWQYPVVIADFITEGPRPAPFTLRDIEEGKIGTDTIVPISTSGFATGTTMKTVAKYAENVPPAKPVAEAIMKSPVDICVYELFDPDANGIRYHAGLIGLNFTKVDETGPTYFMQKVSIQGLFINLTSFADRVLSGQSLGKNLSENATSLVSELFGAIGRITGDRLITSGAILAYNITPVPEPEIVAVSELHAYSPVAESNKVSVLVTGKVINQGRGQTLPNVKLVITPESGGAVITENCALANDSVTSWLSALYLGEGMTGSFKFEKEYTLSDLPAGNYSVAVYVMKSDYLDSPHMSQKLGERHAKFKVIDKATIGLAIAASIIDTGLPWYENYANISLSLDAGFAMTGTPKVIHWTNTSWLPLPDDEETSTMTAQSGTRWTLYEKWNDMPWPDVYVFRIIFTLTIDGEACEIITAPTEIREP